MSYLSKQTMFGEKTNIEYKWGETMKENISYFFFQLVRGKDTSDLEDNLYKLLSEIKTNVNRYQEELVILYKILCQNKYSQRSKYTKKVIYRIFITCYAQLDEY